MKILVWGRNGSGGPTCLRFMLMTLFVTLVFVFGICPECPAGDTARGLGLFAQEAHPAEESPNVEVHVTKEPQNAAEDAKNSAPKLKIEIENKKSAGGAEDKKPPKSMNILPSPEKPIAPVETERIDEAAHKVTRKIDEMGRKTSRYVGRWVNGEIGYRITWLKLGICFVLILVVAGVSRLCQMLIHWRLKRLSANGRPAAWKQIVLEALRRPLRLFVWVYGLYGALALLLVHLDHPWEPNVILQIARKIADVAGAAAIFWFVYGIVREVSGHLQRLAQSPDSKVDVLMASIIGRTIRICIIVIAGILIVQNMTGIDVGPLLASLGLGGLAIALAAKESLTNLFGTITVLLEKPFVVGDRVKIEGYDGMVESLGYRSTRLRTWDGHLVSIPNQKLMGSNFENISRRPHIKWQTNIGITYDSPPEKVRKAVGIVEEILADHEGMDELWPPYVHFTGFDDWCLKISIMAWYSPPDFRNYREWVQKICLAIMRRFEKEGISFAFPTQTVVLKNDREQTLTFPTLQKDPPAPPDGRSGDA